MEKRLEEVIGENVRQRRDRLGYSQAQFGERMGFLLGATWKPQTVSAAEKGRRQFIAAELVTLAHVLNCRVQDLLDVDPPQQVRISDAWVKDADYSEPIQRAVEGSGLSMNRLQEHYSTTYRELLRAKSEAEEIRQRSDNLTQQLDFTGKVLTMVLPDEDEGWDDLDEYTGGDDA